EPGRVDPDDPGADLRRGPDRAVALAERAGQPDAGRVDDGHRVGSRPVPLEYARGALGLTPLDEEAPGRVVHREDGAGGGGVDDVEVRPPVDRKLGQDPAEQ